MAYKASPEGAKARVLERLRGLGHEPTSGDFDKVGKACGVSGTTARRVWDAREGKPAAKASDSNPAPAAAKAKVGGLQVVARKVDPSTVPEFKPAPKPAPPAQQQATLTGTPAPAAAPAQPQPAQATQQQQGPSQQEVQDIGAHLAESLCSIWDARMGGEALTNEDGEPLPPGPITEKERAMLARAVGPAVEKYLPKYAEYHVEVNLGLALIAVFGGRYKQAKAYQEYRKGKAKRGRAAQQRAAPERQEQEPEPVDEPLEDAPEEGDPEDGPDADPEETAALDALTAQMKGGRA